MTSQSGGGGGGLTGVTSNADGRLATGGATPDPSSLLVIGDGAGNAVSSIDTQGGIWLGGAVSDPFASQFATGTGRLIDGTSQSSQRNLASSAFSAVSAIDGIGLLDVLNNGRVNLRGGIGAFGHAAPLTQPTMTLTTSTITDAAAKTVISALVGIINGCGLAAITEN